MIKEVTVKAASIEEAVAQAAAQLGVSADVCTYEVIEKKTKLFSKELKSATVKVSAEVAEEVPAVEEAEETVAAEEAPAAADSDLGDRKIAVAVNYLTDILNAMGLSDVTIKTTRDEEGATLSFEGEGVAVLIGHHGDTLDSLQYLVALACNRIEGDYFRITLDCGDYRDRREETLKALAARLAAKVKKTGRSQLLEPMNPYERRIIHSVVSETPGVFSKSKGEEPNRRVVILSENPTRRYNNNNRGPRKGGNGANGGNRPNNNRGGNRNGGARKPYVHKPERTMEDILKNDFREKEKSAELYSKIEF